MRRINKVVVHYTVSPDIPASTIKQWHVAKGWGDIGYHKVLRRDGSVELGRPESEIGVHTKGFNKESLAVVLTGSDDLSWYPSNAQEASLKRVVNDWQAKYNIPDNLVFLHKELNQTSCAGRLTKDFLKEQPKEHEDMLTEMSPTFREEGVAKYSGLWTGKEHPGLEGYRGDVWLNLNVLRDHPQTVINIHMIKQNGETISRKRTLEKGQGTGILINDYIQGSFRLVVTTPNDEPFDITVKQFFVRG